MAASSRRETASGAFLANWRRDVGVVIPTMPARPAWPDPCTTAGRTQQQRAGAFASLCICMPVCWASTAVTRVFLYLQGVQPRAHQRQGSGRQTEVQADMTWK